MAVDRADADPCGHADFLVGGELAEVGRLQGVQPADLAPFVADDDAGEDRAGEGQGAGDAARDVGVLGDLVVGQADPLRERGEVDPGDLGGGGPSLIVLTTCGQGARRIAGASLSRRSRNSRASEQSLTSAWTFLPRLPGLIST